MDDIAPALLKNIQDTFEDLVKNDKALSRIRKRLESGKASYADAQDYAGRIAKCLQQAYSSHLSADSLPDGRMHYNIANRVLPPTLTRCGGLVSDYCVQVQESINEAAHIGIKAQTAELNSNRIEGLVDRVSEDDFEKTQWVLMAPVDNFCRSTVDDHVKANADFHYKSGLNPKIIRKTDGHCCKWCSSRAGTYPYKPDMDREVFRRHENCGCTVEYDPGNGSAQRQDVWNKRWKDEDENTRPKRLGYRQPLEEFLDKNPKAKTINRQKQGRHIPGDREYVEGKSCLLLSMDECSEILYNEAGNGLLVFDRKGNWKKKERIVADKIVGVVKGEEGFSEDTQGLMIHYSKTGAHLIPRKVDSDELSYIVGGIQEQEK